MTVYTQISQNNWPSSKNQFDDYLALNCPFNQQLGLIDTGVQSGAKLIRSSKAISISGNTSISSAQSKFYGSSAFFDGTGDYLRIAKQGTWPVGTEDATIEFWLYRNTTGGTGPTLVGLDYSGAGLSSFYLTSSNVLYFYDNNLATAGGVGIGGTAVTQNTWQHVALSRNGSALRLFLDGTLIGSNLSASGSWFDSASITTVMVGAREIPLGNQPYQGYLQDLRIYKGIGKYTANFTPPGPILGSA